MVWVMVRVTSAIGVWVGVRDDGMVSGRVAVRILARG